MKPFWSFGFELEGMCFKRDYDSIKELLKSCSEFSCDRLEGFFITGDDTIYVDEELEDLAYSLHEHEIEEIIPLEILLGPFELTEEVQEKVTDLIVEIASAGFSSNETCSLHLHLKPACFPLRSDAAYWSSALLLAYLVESKDYKKFLEYHNYPMWHSHWANPINMIQEYEGLKKNFLNNSNLFDSAKPTKYGMRGLFHMHSMGTIEWRGPRGVFDQNPVTYLNRSSTTYLELVREQINFIFSFFETADLAHQSHNKNYELHSRLLELKDVFYKDCY